MRGGLSSFDAQTLQNIAARNYDRSWQWLTREMQALHWVPDSDPPVPCPCSVAFPSFNPSEEVLYSFEPPILVCLAGKMALLVRTRSSVRTVR